MKKKTKFLASFLALLMLFSTLVPILSIPLSAAETGVAPELGGNYMIVSKLSGKAMTVSGNSADNDASIIQMEANGYASQVWTVADGGTAGGVQYYKLVNYYSGKSMNVPFASVDSGVQMIQWNNGNADNEKWSFTETADGYYRITPKKVANFGLSVAGSSTYRGAGILQETYNGADNMLWSFVAVDEILANPQPEEPDPIKAIDQWLAAFFYVDENGNGQLTNEPSNGFWTDAEMLEVMIDAYERTGDEKYKTVFRQYFDGIIVRRGFNWEWNDFNDDVMWMVIASARAYLLTGETDYLIAAIENFNMCYDRSWDTTHLSGGLWWTTDNNTKNACVNGPGAIAACLLGQATGNKEYYAKAQAIIDWQAEYFLQDDGAVWDSIPVVGNVNTWASTYNQGTFIGACAMLYQYTNDTKYYDWAKSAADYASKMGDGDEGLLNREQNSGDLIGFKGILGRWIGYFARECNVTDYDVWMYNNAKAAWNNRNSDDLMWTQFGRMTEENLKNSTTVINGSNTISTYAAWGSSAAVSWLLNYTGEVEVEQASTYSPELAVREMEYGTVAGGQVVSNDGMSNGKYVGNLGGDNNGSVTFYIESKRAAEVTIRISYATYKARTLGVTVNGTLQTYDCPATGDWTALGTPVEMKINLKKGTNVIVFGGVNGGDAPNLDKFEIAMPVFPEEPTQRLKFYSATLTLQANLQLNYRVKKSLFTEVGYADPYVVFEMNGVETVVREYTEEEEYYIFRFKNIGPKMLKDTVYATLHADYNGSDYASNELPYSVATYCYHKLAEYTPEENPDKAEFLTLLVDLLNYGAAAQQYLDYNTGYLCNAKLTAEQKSWGTADVDKPDAVLNTRYEAIENPTVGWIGARLNLGDTVKLYIKLSAEDIEGLSVKVSVGGKEWNISSEAFEPTEDGYYDLLLGGLLASQMRETIYVTVYKDGAAVSDTLSYSIGSYANSKWESTDAELVTLVKEMMKYGDAAKAYAESLATE